MATPSINGQLGWENDAPYYIVAWDHTKGQPSISQSVELEYHYGTETVDFAVEYIPSNSKKKITSYDGLLSITAERSGKYFNSQSEDLYLAIASGYADAAVDAPEGFTVRGRPYYITALNTAEKSEVYQTKRSLRFELIGDAALDQLYHLATYTDYKGQERQFWTPVDERDEVQQLGVYAIMTKSHEMNGVQG